MRKVIQPFVCATNFAVYSQCMQLRVSSASQHHKADVLWLVEHAVLYVNGVWHHVLEQLKKS